MKNLSLKNRVSIGAVLIVVFVLFIAVFTSGVFAKGGDGMCQVAQGSQFLNVNGIYQIDGSNVDVYVHRGIAGGQPAYDVKDSSEVLPSCFSNEAGFTNVTNLWLVDKKTGNKIYLVKGVVGGNGTETSPLS